MMNTPICNFVKKYISENMIRLHMPGHKGVSYLGIEPFDITEIKGADSLFEADSIIKKSEKNASLLFDSDATYYSTEGSSLCIRTMIALVVKYAIAHNKRPHIIAARNSHKTFISACALLDFTFSDIPENEGLSYLICNVAYNELEEKIKKENPVALYVNYHDYLGCHTDLQRLSSICKQNDVLLVVDNAHGAYFNFTKNTSFPKMHPLELGADLCCDSAHKTLPVLTGGAYLHVSKNAPSFFKDNIKSTMSLFASTSPSYLILQSLDNANALLSSTYKQELSTVIDKLSSFKLKLHQLGIKDISAEPLKISILTKPYGYTGYQYADELRKLNIECEFADPDFTVLMFTPNNGDLEMIFEKILSIPRKPAIEKNPPKFTLPERVLSVKEAIFSNSEKIPVSMAEGRILSSLNVGCPPAVPIVVCGERINSSAINLFKYYGIEYCDVVI